MAMAFRQHHLLLGLGGQGVRTCRKLPFYPVSTDFRRVRSVKLAVGATAAGSFSSEESGPAGKDSSVFERIAGKDSSVFERIQNQQARWEELSTPVPEPPKYMLWAAGFGLLYLTRHAVLAELIQWASVVAIIGLMGFRITKRLLVALSLKAIQLLKEPIAFVLTSAAWSGLFARDMYSVIVNTTKVWPTVQVLLLVTLVLSLGEATNPTAVSGQPWAFILVSALAVGAVFGVIHHSVFVLSLLLLTAFALVVQKKDAVSAVLPTVSVLVAVAEPPVKIFAIAMFTVLAIYSHWKTLRGEAEIVPKDVPIVQPLLIIVAAFFVGITVGTRFLRTQQVLWLAKG